MRFHPSRFVLAAARKWPRSLKPILWLWGKVLGYAKLRPHRLFIEAANTANYRAPYWATLKNGQKMKVAVNDVARQHVILSGWTEPESIDAISKLVKSGDVFFDIGAHIGHYTLVASSLVGNDGQVHSFEPEPISYRWLCDNLRRNCLTNVFPNQSAVTESVGYCELFLAAPENIGSNSITLPRNPSGRALRVPSISIAAYCQSRYIQRNDFIKIDVEGAECEVLRGGAGFFKCEDRPILHIEFNEKQHKALGRSLDNLAGDLTTFGYHLLRMTTKGPEKFWLSTEEPLPFNVLAVPDSRISSIAL